jgi:hypothetical protein
MAYEAVKLGVCVQTFRIYDLSSKRQKWLAQLLGIIF